MYRGRFDGGGHVPRQVEAPGLPLYLSEPGRAAADYGLYLATRPLLDRLPHGDGHPVLVLPGLLADDVSTRTLRRAPRRPRYPAPAWGPGAPTRPPPACV